MAPCVPFSPFFPLLISRRRPAVFSPPPLPTFRIWDANTGVCQAVLVGHSGRLNAVRVSDHGKWAVTASDDGTARVWSTRSGACLQVLQGHKSWVADVALVPGSRGIVVTASADGTAAVYSVDSGEVERVLAGHSGPLNGAVVSRKGR